MPDLPKYIGIEGSHRDFEQGNSPDDLGEYSQLVASDDYDAASNAVNTAFASTNAKWDDGGGEYPHMSELYVRTRDVAPLLRQVRTMLEEPAVFGLNQGVQAELQRCADYLKDMKV